MIKKKIMILGKLPPPYMGPSIATQILLNSDLKNRFELTHLNTKINYSISSMGTWSAGKVVKNISIYFKMLHLLIKHKPDVVLIPISQTTTGFIKDAIFIVLASLFKTKILIQLRGSNFENWLSHSSQKVKTFVKYIIHKTHGVIVLGNNLKYLFKDYFSDEKIFVIPNGGNYSFPHKSNTNSKNLNILYFSNLLESKGIEDVFEAVSILSKNKLNTFSVDCVGEWNSEDIKKKCLDLKDKEQLPIHVHSPKGGTEKIIFLSSADIFIFPPREPEGHPWAIVEAMAAELPIISTNQGAIIESVIHEKNGFIVPPKKPEIIAQKLQLLLDNPELRAQMGKESRNLYQQYFTEEKMIDTYTRVFNKIIENGK